MFSKVVKIADSKRNACGNHDYQFFKCAKKSSVSPDKF
jgi:hypothetical protein